MRGLAGGPAVLLSRAEPWGVCGLSPRECEQVRVSTLLLHAFLVLAAALSHAGGFALLEHPAEPDRPGEERLARLTAGRVEALRS